MNPNRFHRPLTRRSFQSRTAQYLLTAAGLLAVGFLVAIAAETVPTDIMMPGTQPDTPENAALGLPPPPGIDPVGNCGCHSFNGNRDADAVPVFGWEGMMMGNAGRDPLFWSTVAIAEQDFLPGSGGVGDLCLRCHSLHGWLEGRSTPTNGSGLDPNVDNEGIMCHFCHQMVDPDQAVNIPSPSEGSYSEAQGGDFVAYDESDGEGYYGGAEFVLNGGGTRLGPFTDHTAKHDAIGSSFFRDANFCGTCHDVSNPAVGDLAHNNGAMSPLDPATFSGAPGGPVAGKAAFNNEPYHFGIVERTFSEYLASAFPSLAVQDFNTLPADLKVVGGSLEMIYQRSLWGNCSATTEDYCNTDTDCPTGETCVVPTDNVNYEDGTVRTYTCQTCHMSASVGEGAGNARRPRPDIPRHDLTGGSVWIQDAIRWQDEHGTLRFGAGDINWPSAEHEHAQARAGTMLESAASLSATQDGNMLKVTVTNLTGHKLITGYPEGRRMFLNIKWYDGADALIYENGSYGPLGNVVQDLAAVDWDVMSIQDLDSTKIWEAKPGISRGWAQQLLALGYPSEFVIEWDRMTNTPKYTLGDLGNWPTANGLKTFHFVLNNTVIKDNRIPPYGFDRHEAFEHNALPVPHDQFGNPSEGGTYNHWDDVMFPVPVGAVRAEVTLYYQSTSWEYIQFLWKQNDGSDAFLGNEGINMMDAWLNTGMAPPYQMAATPSTAVTAPVSNPPGGAGGAAGLMGVTGYDSGTGAIALSFAPACDSTGHTVHYGNLADVSTYGWAGADCGLDASGSGSFIPDPAAGEAIFFVVVGHNGDWEGGYGEASNHSLRPANTLAAGACLRQSSVRNFCE